MANKGNTWTESLNGSVKAVSGRKRVCVRQVTIMQRYYKLLKCFAVSSSFLLLVTDFLY